MIFEIVYNFFHHCITVIPTTIFGPISNHRPSSSDGALKNVSGSRCQLFCNSSVGRGQCSTTSIQISFCTAWPSAALTLSILVHYIPLRHACSSASNSSLFNGDSAYGTQRLHFGFLQQNKLDITYNKLKFSGISISQKRRVKVRMQT